jgi:negative regulator of sigma E activity
LREDFTMRFHERLQQEPTLLALRFRWRRTVGYALSAAASLAAVALVATLAMVGNPLKPQSPIATAPKEATAQVATNPVSMPTHIDAGRFNRYLMAHHSFSPTISQDVAAYASMISTTRDEDRR